MFSPVFYLFIYLCFAWLPLGDSVSLCTLNISSPISGPSAWDFGSAYLAEWIINGSPVFHKFHPSFFLPLQQAWCRLHLLIFTAPVYPPSVPEPNGGAFAQEIFSALWQLDGKKENLWPWKMKMLLPWELLILLSLKECLAGEMSVEVASYNPPNMNTAHLSKEGL